MRSNQQGWALISLLLVTPLLLSVTIVTSWLLWFGFRKQQAETLCQNHLLKAQQSLIRATEDLLDLNSNAQQLIQEKQYWTKILRAAPGPTKAAVAARLALTLAKQQALAIQQKSIIYLGQTQAFGEINKLRSRLFKQLQSMSSAWGGQKSFPQIQARPLGPQVKPTSIELAPLYRRKVLYKDSQQLKLNWAVDLNKNGPYPWLKFIMESRWKASCYSHPRSKGHKWTANLGKARF